MIPSDISEIGNANELVKSTFTPRYRLKDTGPSVKEVQLGSGVGNEEGKDDGKVEG